MTNKTGVKAVHKGLDYGDMTSDKFDGPRTSADKKQAKRMAAKRQRRKATQEIKEEQ